jgi:hypothetical protein
VTQQAPRAASVPVVITSKTWARKITIQGGPSTEKRFLKANLKPGRYTILIQRYETRRHTITVKADGPNRFSL